MSSLNPKQFGDKYGTGFEHDQKWNPHLQRADLDLTNGHHAIQSVLNPVPRWSDAVQRHGQNWKPYSKGHSGGNQNTYLYKYGGDPTGTLPSVRDMIRKAPNFGGNATAEGGIN